VVVFAVKQGGFLVAAPTVREESRKEKSFSSTLVNWRGVVLAVVTILYILSLSYLGFFLSTAIYLFCLFWMLGNRKVFLFGPAALILAVIANYVVQDVLQINVPTLPFVNLPFGL
jgi:hypothetical protein